MVLRSGNAKRKEDQQVLGLAYHIRKLAVALSGKAGDELVVYNIDTGAPAFRKPLTSKAVHIQWKSNSSLFLITQDYSLLEICIATGKVGTTQLVSKRLQERQWEITAGAVWRKGEGRKNQGLAVALAVKCDRDIVQSAIKAGSDLYGKHRKRKAKTREDKYDENGEEIQAENSEDDEFEEKVALLTWHLSPERQIESKRSAFFEDSHSEPVHSMLFVENLLLTGGEDGLMNVFDVNEVDEDEAIQTTVMAESSISKISPLKNDLFGVVTDDNKQLLIRKNAADDFDILHKRVVKRGHFLIDLVPGKDEEKPIAAVEADPRGEVTITVFDELGKNAELLVRSYTHSDLLKFVSAQGNIVLAMDCEANWSAYNITNAEGNIAEEKPVEEEGDEATSKPHQYHQHHDRFKRGRGGFQRQKFNENRTPKEPGVVSFEGDETTAQGGRQNFAQRNFAQRRQFHGDGGEDQHFGQRSFAQRRQFHGDGDGGEDQRFGQRNFAQKRQFHGDGDGDGDGGEDQHFGQRNFAQRREFHGDRDGDGDGGEDQHFGQRNFPQKRQFHGDGGGEDQRFGQRNFAQRRQFHGDGGEDQPNFNRFDRNGPRQSRGDGNFRKFGQKRGGFNNRGSRGGGNGDRMPSTLGGGRYKPY